VSSSPKLTEARFQGMVVKLAMLRGFLVFHPRKALARSGRWLTALQGHKGFPDLVLARDKILFVELKTDEGRLTAEQKRWREVILNAGGEYRLWRPCCWQAIEKELE